MDELERTLPIQRQSIHEGDDEDDEDGSDDDGDDKDGSDTDDEDGSYDDDDDSSIDGYSDGDELIVELIPYRS